MDKKKNRIQAGICLAALVLTACLVNRSAVPFQNSMDVQHCAASAEVKENRCRAEGVGAVTNISKADTVIGNMNLAENDMDAEMTDLTIGENGVEDVQVLPQEYVIENFPIIYQMPELPTGCEITALTMALNYYGYDADKVSMATEYLPTASANLHYGTDGRLYGSDLNEYCIGDPTTDLGYICGTGAIQTAADRYLTATGAVLHAEDRTGAEPDELYELVSNDIPVVVWVTIGMADRQSTQGWYTENGEYVDWSRNDHGAVLIGYSEDTVIIADPISGQMEYSRAQFESVFASRGSQCVILL